MSGNAAAERAGHQPLCTTEHAGQLVRLSYWRDETEVCILGGRKGLGCRSQLVPPARDHSDNWSYGLGFGPSARASAGRLAACICHRGRAVAVQSAAPTGSLPSVSPGAMVTARGPTGAAGWTGGPIPVSANATPAYSPAASQDATSLPGLSVGPAAGTSSNLTTAGAQPAPDFGSSDTPGAAPKVQMAATHDWQRAAAPAPQPDLEMAAEAATSGAFRQSWMCQ